MMKALFSSQLCVIAILVMLTACKAIGQPKNQKVNQQVSPLSVQPVNVDQYGLFTVADCPTTHPVLEVKLHEGEYCIDRADIYADGMLMQSVPINEDDAVTLNIVHFLDANFDGNVDIFIGPGSNREYSIFIVWDETEKRFAHGTNDGFTVFNGDFYFNAGGKAVYRMTSSSAFETTYTKMIWRGTDLQSEEVFLQVFEPSYYDFHHVTHRYTVRGYYSGDDVISTDDPTLIPEPWNKWLSRLNEDD